MISNKYIIIYKNMGFGEFIGLDPSSETKKPDNISFGETFSNIGDFFSSKNYEELENEVVNKLGQIGNELLKVMSNTNSYLKKFSKEIFFENIDNMIKINGIESVKNFISTYIYLKKIEEIGFIKDVSEVFVIKCGLDWNNGNEDLLQKYKKDIISFQIAYGVINNQSDLGAGIIGPRTKIAINKAEKKYGKILKKAEKYKDYLTEIVKNTGIPYYFLITLIEHENPRWNPNWKSANSSAEGLGQSIKSNWDTYGSELRRWHPKDQILVLADFVLKIKKTKGCSWDEVYGYYNAGLNIKNVSNGKIKENTKNNPQIASRIPDNEKITAETYWKGAIAFYTGKKYSQIDHYKLV